MKSRRRPVAGLGAATLIAAHLAATPQQAPSPEALAKAATQMTKTSKDATNPKLDPPLQAVARAWRRYGASGAERECAARSIALKDLRLSAVIHLTAEQDRSRVEQALRKAWGEVKARHEERLYVRLPVPAIRRMSQHAGVQAIYIDTPVSTAGDVNKE